MVNNLTVLGSEAAYFHIISRNSGASFGKIVKVERTVDGVGRGGIERGGGVERRVLSRAIVLGTSYCSRRCIVRDVVLFEAPYSCKSCIVRPDLD